jgi:hypothetical protein
MAGMVVIGGDAGKDPVDERRDPDAPAAQRIKTPVEQSMKASKPRRVKKAALEGDLGDFVFIGIDF